MSPTVVWALALSITSIAAALDFRTGRIPNWLTAGGFVLAVAVHGSAGWSGLSIAVLGLAANAFVPVLLYALSRGRALGGGDVKLFAALGAMLGPFSGLEVQLLSYLVLLFLALCQLSYQGHLLRTFKNAALLLVHRWLPKARAAAPDPTLFTAMRLGPAIFVACALLAAQQYVPGLPFGL